MHRHRRKLFWEVGLRNPTSTMVCHPPGTVIAPSSSQLSFISLIHQQILPAQIPKICSPRSLFCYFQNRSQIFLLPYTSLVTIQVQTTFSCPSWHLTCLTAPAACPPQSRQGGLLNNVSHVTTFPASNPLMALHFLAGRETLTSQYIWRGAWGNLGFLSHTSTHPTNKFCL